MKAVLSENEIGYLFADITGSMAALKSFLVLRDTSEAYAQVRGTRTVGIPLLVVDGEPYIVEDEDHARALVETLHLTE